MNRLKDLIKNRINFFYSESESMNKKNFYLIMMFTFALSLILIVRNAISYSNSVPGKYALVFCVFILAIGYLADRFNEFHQYSSLYSTMVNFFVFPVFYFLMGDVAGGTLLFWMLGIILTFFLLGESKSVWLYIALEYADYLWILYYTYHNRDRLFMLRNENMSNEPPMVIAFFLASLIMISIFVYQTSIYVRTRGKSKQAKEAIVSAEASKSRFLANMTHEIRTPMNAIMGMSELILHEDLNKASREQTETIKQAASELLKIINNVLEFSKLDSQKMELIMKKYSFRDMIKEIVNSVAIEYSSKDMDFHVYVDKNIPNYLFGDDVRIKQVFRYLLLSYLNQASYGSVYLEIKGELIPAEHSIKLKCRIATTGEGLTEEEIDETFGAYSSYDSRQRSNFRGMGLELSICKAILDMMGGSLDIKSIVKIGTAVSFEFSNYIIDDECIISRIRKYSSMPLIYLRTKSDESGWQAIMEEFDFSPTYVLGPVAFKIAIENKKYSQIYVPDSVYPEVAGIIESAGCEDYTYVITDCMHSYKDFGDCKILRHPVYCLNLIESIDGSWKAADYQKPIDNVRITFPGAKILIVDDSIVNLKVLEGLLDKFDIKPDKAESGAECLEKIRDIAYDIVFLDQRMPEMDGTETLYKIRSMDELTRDVPIVCVTAEFGSDIRKKLLREGFNDYLAKPINVVFLERLLTQFLPEGLMVKVETKRERDAKDIQAADPDTVNDPQYFEPQKGIRNLGDNREAYISVLLAYYKEGQVKLKDVPAQAMQENLSLYTSNVHALKSSSAAVGAMGISECFKGLEYAAKRDDKDYILANSENTFEEFKKVLELVREFLTNEGVEIEENDADGNEDKELTKLDISDITELEESLMSVNLKRCEEILEKLGSNNYGPDNNARIRDIQKSYEVFEYHKVKDMLVEFIKELNLANTIKDMSGGN